ncbi:MAG: T9SS type A sorting domain-containing protein [Bacteroidetes bacterium]|nr:T9SS type A sorting domain-containing protein [Bacteroidota bacterium]
MNRWLPLLFVCITAQIFAQTFNSPESVEYDAARDRYIVSNTGGNNLLAVVPGNAPTLFKSGVTAPYGMVILGDTVFVCAQSGYIKAYDLTTGNMLSNINLGGTFLNGICTDFAGNLYATDFSAKKIYRYDIATQQFNVFVNNMAKTPNGIVYDPFHNRLVVATWGANAAVLSVNMSDSSVTTLVGTSLSNIDGISIDEDGNFYLAEWGTDDIYFLDSAFSTAPIAVVNGSATNPADIHYNVLRDTLAVPNTSTNTITFHPFPRPQLQDDTLSLCTDSVKVICVLDNDALSSGTMAIQSFTFAQLGNAVQSNECIEYTALQAGQDTIYCKVCTNALPSFCKTSALVVTNTFCGDTTTPSSIDKPENAFADAKLLPSGTELVIYTGNSIVGEVSGSLMDVSGRVVSVAATNDAELHLPINGLLPGIYFATLRAGQARTTYKVFIR